jgi:hypothetical protein
MVLCMGEFDTLGRGMRCVLEDCLKRYDDVTAVLDSHRHVVMVIDDGTDAASQGWTLSARRNASELARFNTTYMNSVWRVAALWRTDELQEARAGDVRNELRGSNSKLDRRDFENSFKFYMDLAMPSRTLKMDVNVFQEPQQTMQALYCLSEPYMPRCQVEVNNILLLVVLVATFVKAMLCVFTIYFHRAHNPLITLGDAIESFISQPDPGTALMCTLSGENFPFLRSFRSSRSSWPPRLLGLWTTKRRLHGRAVPTGIWIWSYVLIGGGLGFAGLLFSQALASQSM